MECDNCETKDEIELDYSSGDYICTSCGIVQRERVVDSGKEWRDFEVISSSSSRSESNRTRAEKIIDNHTTLESFVDLCFIDGFDEDDFFASNVSSSLLSSREKSLRAAFVKINQLSETLQFPQKICSRAKEITVQVNKWKDPCKIRGFTKDAFCLAVLLLASRDQGGRSIRSISLATHIPEKDIKRHYRMLLREKQLSSINSFLSSPFDQLKDMLRLYCNQLNLPFYVVNEATKVGENAIEILEGKRISSVAAATLLCTLKMLGFRENFDITGVANISSTTLRNSCKALLMNSDKLWKDEILSRKENPEKDLCTAY